jgi:hypothetical protein
MITWDDILTHLVCSKLTGEESNPIFKEIYEHLQYWIPSIIQDTLVTINNKYSYYYNSKTKGLLIDYDNIWWVFKSRYGMEYSDIQTLVIRYTVDTHNIEVGHMQFLHMSYTVLAGSTHNIEVKHTCQQY